MCYSNLKSVNFLILSAAWIVFVAFPQISEAKTIEMPVMAKKMGSSWKHDLKPQPSSSEDQQPVIEIKNESKSEENDEYYDSYYYDDYSSEEVKCPRGMFYFLRSKMCVPNRCYGGNKYRNTDGSCVPKHRVDYEIERRMYPERLKSVDKPPRRYRTPIELNKPTLIFAGKVGRKG